MSKRVTLQISATVLALCMLLVPGVYGVWFYETVDAILPASPFSQQTNINLGFSQWKDWSGEDELPDNVQGENHAQLMDDVLNSPTSGLNAEDSQLLELINTREDRNKDTFGSMDNGWLGIVGGNTGSDLKDSLGLSEDCQDLTFVIQWIDENNDGETDFYYIYSTNINLGESRNANIAVGNYIYEIYRTEVRWLMSVDSDEDGILDKEAWTPVSTVLGAAKSAYYSEYSITGWFENLNQIPSFDVTTFVEGERGTDFSDAIWVYNGYSNYIYPVNTAELTYFQINGQANTEYTIRVTIAQTANPAVRMNVYTDASGATASSTLNGVTTQTETVTNDDGTTTTNRYLVYEYTYTPTNGGVFYFAPSGSLSMKVEITY